MSSLRIKLKKTSLKVKHPSTAHKALGAVHTIGHINGTSYNGYTRTVGDTTEIIAIHSEKRRGKMVEVRGTGKKDRTKIERVWQPSYWLITATHIPVELLKYLPGGEFIQHWHHWEIISK